MVRLGRDGGVQQFELTGLLTLRITDENLGRIKVKLANNDTQGIQLQTHPNVDKELFKTRAMIGLKNPAKPFPLNTDVGVLKWRYITQDESAIPLTSECITHTHTHTHPSLAFPLSVSYLIVIPSLSNSQLTVGPPTTAKADAT